MNFPAWSGRSRTSVRDHLRWMRDDAATDHPAPAEQPASRADILATLVQATTELAEIGIALTAHAIRSALARLPRPQ
jgi:hypothetical protein